MKQALAFTFIIISFLLAFCLRGYYKISKADPEDGYTFNKYQSAFDKRFAMVKIPTELDFAGEAVPIHELEIRERFAKEYMSDAYWLLPSIFRDAETFKIYSNALSILKRKGIPADFAYLLIAESTVRNRVSQKGAAGIWQLMPESARGLGLEVNENVDERYHYIKATYAACDYLKQAHQEFGNWTLAAASYNMGIGGISRKVGGDSTKSYFDLYLNKETARYIFRILAIKEVMKNPGKYSYFQKRNSNSKTINLKIDTTINNLQIFSENLGYDIFILKKYNPWLLSNQLPVTEGKTYTIEFPILEKIEDVTTATPAAIPDTQTLNHIQQYLFHFDSP